MKIVSAEFYALGIPFRASFGHHLMTRNHSDSVVVRLISDCGHSGYGEGVPRPYVTGETVPSCLHHIEHILLPLVGQYDFAPSILHSGVSSLLSEVDALLPVQGNDTVIAFNAARAAVETALIDLLFKRIGRSLGSALPPSTSVVEYSAVISADSVERVRKIASACGHYGIRHIKIKVGTDNDYARIAAVRDLLGDSVSLRLDANCAFDVESACAFIASIQSFHIACIEQPLPRSDLKGLAEVTLNSPIPIMADESLITESDAVELIEMKACDFFNLRISKNGGIGRTIRLAERARKSGVGFQLGCQVGETAILSAAGRHVAAYLSDSRYVEGSYGSLLLADDIAHEPVQFGFGGKASILAKTGLGIDIHKDILDKYAVQAKRMELS